MRAVRGSRLWIGLCSLVLRVFYRRVEVVGRERLDFSGPGLVCANHNNSLADVVLLQGASPRLLHPLARSGLFEKLVLRRILAFIQAVPVYRAHDAPRSARGEHTGQNRGSFDRCFELLESGGALVVFPEGISHSQPQLQPFKTGAARIALGHTLRGGEVPTVLPVGLTFLEKGRFRSRVLIQVGEPVEVQDLVDAAERSRREAGQSAEDASASPPADEVRQLTRRIDGAIRELTINHDNWEDLALLRQLERFFHFRSGRRPSSQPLAERFRTFQRLLDQHRRLRVEVPDEVASLRRKLEWFERLRRLYGIDDYHLRISYRWPTAARFVLANLLFFAVALPAALWGVLTSGPPWAAARFLGPRTAASYDQWETSKIVVGLVAFSAFWGGQLGFLSWRFGLWPATALYALSLPVGGIAAWVLVSRRRRIVEEIRAFWLFSRRRELQRYLLDRRVEIEDDLARLSRHLKAAGPARPAATLRH